MAEAASVDGDEIEAAFGFGKSDLSEVMAGRIHEASLLVAGQGFFRSLGAFQALFDLDKDDDRAVQGDEVDLASPGFEPSVNEGVALGLQVLGRPQFGCAS